ncbi:MAG TPA: ImmA/IrrE family metallo-endopeptidase [Puia sp.]|nr:ImmA/IrrE family metallo-endopeptidase [Puia sp.]
MNRLSLQAMKKAGQIRAKLKMTSFEPVNIFDVCATLGVTVRFIDVSMEGMYVNIEGAESQVVLISSLRPLPRRVYTCAHELGHHLFGHGSRVDGLTDENTSSSVNDKDEYLVDAFAGAFLMPLAGIDAEFMKRGWSVHAALPLQFYTISSIFGTGYSTLITHCQVNRIINEAEAVALEKQKPSKLLKQLMGKDVINSHFKIIDGLTDIPVIDLEVGNYLFLPPNMCIEGGHMVKLRGTDIGNVFVAGHPGIARAVSNDKAHFIRIQNAGYVGLAENRHLEDKAE